MSAASPSAALRLQRLLAMVPWIAANDGPTVEEICSRFGITSAELASDLDVIWLVGLPPYTPDALVDVVQEGDRVWIRYAEMFATAHRLTPDQAVALLIAGASVLALPGADPDGDLAHGVAKLAEVLGVEREQILDIDLGAARPDIVDTLRTAVREGRRVRIDYYSYGRDTRRVRDVDPHVVHAEAGNLYLVGWCHDAGGERRFRVDRVAAASLLDEPATVTAAPDGATELFRADDDDPRVVLDLPATAGWVAEAYPVEQVRAGKGGRLRVTLAVAAVPWLERLLVSLGPDARMVDGPPELAAAGSRAADRILARYR
jgi:proteasome accessory factor C